jgi:ribonuclease VapC
MAIVLDEPEADACIAALEAEGEILISAGTVAEALIVSARRNVDREIGSIIDRLGFEIVTVTPASARRIAEAYQRWGRGLYPAALNFGDCFAYEVAKEHACRLLYVGDDFAKTDIEAVL